MTAIRAKMSRVPAGLAALTAIALWMTGTPSALAAAGKVAAETAAAYERTKSRFQDSQFHAPLILESTVAGDRVSGDVYALVDHAVVSMGKALDSAAAWCDVMILQLNVKSCNASEGKQAALDLKLGRKGDTAEDGGSPLRFQFMAPTATPEHLHVAMKAPEGPMQTSDYHLELRAIPADRNKAFVWVSYNYRIGPAAKLAMNSYLSTLGRRKVGFTVVGKNAAGEPKYVQGVRGTVERNAMRYYLALDTYLESLRRPAGERRQWSHGAWYDATERYSRQLHEMSKQDYLATKR